MQKNSPNNFIPYPCCKFIHLTSVSEVVNNSRKRNNQPIKNMSAYDDDRGGSSPDRSPNDDRSDVMNPNNDAYDADQANRASQDED